MDAYVDKEGLKVFLEKVKEYADSKLKTNN